MSVSDFVQFKRYSRFLKIFQNHYFIVTYETQEPFLTTVFVGNTKEFKKMCLLYINFIIKSIIRASTSNF